MEGLEYFSVPVFHKFSKNFSFSKEASHKFLVLAFSICKKFLRKFLLFAFLIFESKNLKLGKRCTTHTFWKSIRKIKLLKLQKETWKPQFLPAVHGTIRRQFVNLIGKFSLSEKNLRTFRLYNFFEKQYGCLDFDFRRWTFQKCNLQ